uniref:Uncharacterized protein n=1 Tax=Podoviridae sp. ctt6T3 TaxID=2825282 RepID=A0A8S5PTI8_9CAUD|nr:MAG TPA: hypothetical protein [Podoviridae sp. ctt6T3]
MSIVKLHKNTGDFCAVCTNLCNLHKLAGAYTAQFVHIV